MELNNHLMVAWTNRLEPRATLHTIEPVQRYIPSNLVQRYMPSTVVWDEVYRVTQTKCVA
jgi:hypothetical protein